MRRDAGLALLGLVSLIYLILVVWFSVIRLTTNYAITNVEPQPVAGAMRVLAAGLAEPESVLAATREYAEEEDALGRFVDECLDLVHLALDVAPRRPSELSGGMRRRVGFARAISLQPEILLFDEPTTGLDPVISDVIADLILEMDDTLHTTTVTITHDMKVAFKIADRVAMLFKGQIVEQGTPEEFQASTNPVVRQFIEGRAEGPLTE